MLTTPLPGMRLDPAHPLNRGLVAFWPLNTQSGTKAYDIVTGLSGTLNNVVKATSPAAGFFGGPQGTNSLMFDGTDDYIAFPDFSRFFGSAATVSMLIKSSVGPTAGFGQLGNSGQENHYPFSDTNIYLDVFKTSRVGLGASLVTVGEWHRLTVTSFPGATNWRVYQNNRILGTDTGEASISFPTAPFIGRGVGGGFFFQGGIADLRFWNRALTAGEINLLNADPFGVFQSSVKRRFTSAPVGTPGSTSDALIIFRAS